MAESKKKAAAKKPEKRADPMGDLMKAIEKAREAGLVVTASVTEITDDGVSINRSNK